MADTMKSLGDRIIDAKLDEAVVPIITQALRTSGLTAADVTAAAAEVGVKPGSRLMNVITAVSERLKPAAPKPPVPPAVK